MRRGTRILLEVAVASVADAVAARDGGADRLELCAALALGGLTPSPGMLAEVRRAAALPVVAMARPRAGGFAYSDAEFRVLRRDLDFLLDHGADGIVFGVLEEDGRIDLRRCRDVVRQAEGRPIVFHRAFDLTPDALAALDQLTDLGVRRVLTSGRRPTALAGADLIAALRERAAGRIEILPGAGVTATTAAALLTRTGCEQVHASLRTRRLDPSTSARPAVSFGGYEVTDPGAVAALRAVLDGVA